jgi:hypothetical protein
MGIQTVHRARLPVCGPAVLLQKLLASLFEVEVGSEIGYVQRFPGDGILRVAAEVLDDGGALVRLAGFCL